MWFTEYNNPLAIGKITPSGVITSYSIPNPPGYGPADITPGRDGDLWYTASGIGGYIGRITPSGTRTEITPADDAEGITAGRGGNVWFTAVSGPSGSIGAGPARDPQPPGDRPVLAVLMRGPRPGPRRSLGAPEGEIDQLRGAGREHAPGCLRCHARLERQVVEQHRLGQLCLRDRRGHIQQWLTGEHAASLGHSPHVTGEP
jgi:hypothetical protein